MLRIFKFIRTSQGLIVYVCAGKYVCWCFSACLRVCLFCVSVERTTHWRRHPVKLRSVNQCLETSVPAHAGNLCRNSPYARTGCREPLPRTPALDTAAVRAICLYLSGSASALPNVSGIDIF